MTHTPVLALSQEAGGCTEVVTMATQ